MCAHPPEGKAKLTPQAARTKRRESPLDGVEVAGVDRAGLSSPMRAVEPLEVVRSQTILAAAELRSGLRDKLELDVFKENAKGRRFYERYGFKFVTEHVHQQTGRVQLRLALTAD